MVHWKHWEITCKFSVTAHSDWVQLRGIQAIQLRCFAGLSRNSVLGARSAGLENNTPHMAVPHAAGLEREITLDLTRLLGLLPGWPGLRGKGLGGCDGAVFFSMNSREAAAWARLFFLMSPCTSLWLGPQKPSLALPSFLLTPPAYFHILL